MRDLIQDIASFAAVSLFIAVFMFWAELFRQVIL